MKSYLEAKNQGEGKPRDIKERTFRFSVNIVQLCQLMSEKPGVMRTLTEAIIAVPGHRLVPMSKKLRRDRAAPTS